MRRIIPVVSFISGNLILLLILHSFFPKYHGFAIYICLSLMMDIYLWVTVKRSIYKIHKVLRYPVIILYWAPLGLLLLLALYAQFVSFILWNITFRTWMISLFFITFFSKTAPILFTLTADLYRLILALIRRKTGIRPFIPVRRNRRILTTGWITGSFFWLILFSGMLFWVYDFKVREEAIYISDLPDEFDGFRIVHVSDLHLGSWCNKSELKRVTETIHSLNPDIVAVTGDIFNFSTYDGDGFRDILSEWKGKYGTFCILGNHDYGDYVRWSSPYRKIQNMDALIAFYHQIGWVLLMNESRIVTLNGDSLAIVGVENWGAASRFQKRADLNSAIKNLPAGITKILLSHDPEYWNQFISNEKQYIPLTLSGHTHGGQFGLRTGDFCWSPVSLASKYWIGKYSVKDGEGMLRYLHVNPGLGTIGYRGRVGINPEITLLTLKRVTHKNLYK